MPFGKLSLFIFGAIALRPRWSRLLDIFSGGGVDS